MSLRRILRGAAIAAPLSLYLQAASTASLDVNPVRIDLTGPDRPGALRLTNTGEREISVQVDVREWSQQPNGADELVPTDALLAVPPLFTIAPGARQIVRIGYLDAPLPEVERSFRLLVTELASPAGASATTALNMRVRLSLPVFVAPSVGVATPEVVLGEVSRASDGTRVELRNAGTGHVKLHEVEWLDGGRWISTSQTVGFVRYLLPEARFELHIPDAPESVDAVRITSADGRGWVHAMPGAP